MWGRFAAPAFFMMVTPVECGKRKGILFSSMGENAMRILLMITLFLFTAPVAWAVSVPPHVPPAVLEEFTSVESVKLHEILGTTPPPSIPKSWKLISVSAGEKSNSSNLWFQDSEGSVYLLQGFTSQNKFFIHENVYKFPAK
jgi:hypothetical protein